MNRWISVVILVACSSLWAAGPERPELPGPGIDEKLMEGKAPRTFFEDRAKAAPASCLADLAAAKKNYRDTLKEFNEMKAAGKPGDELDAKEADLKARRLDVMALMELKDPPDGPGGGCGECATNPVKPHVFKTAARTVTWYVSEGTCQIPSTDKKVLTKAYEALVKSLTHAKNYARFSEGGFDNILDLQVVEEKGALFNFLPKQDAFPPSPTYLAVWVRGPLLPFATDPLGFRYFIKAEYGETSSTPGAREFLLTFDTKETAKQYSKITFPIVSDHKASGKIVPVTPVTLSNVLGEWYISEDGYIRYFTAAEFPVKMAQIESLGRSILLDTLVELSERGQWE